MSESKFLPFQDKDGDGAHDDCPEVLRVPEPKDCPECEPNSSAVVDNWREKNRFESFLNEKNCKYQTTIVAKEYTTTGADADATEAEAETVLNKIYGEYEDLAIESLLETLDKDNGAGSIETVRAAIEYTDYWLAPRAFSRLKLLYSVPHEVVTALPSRDADEEEEENIDDVEVTFSAHEMDGMMMHVRKGLALYNRYLKVFRALEKGNLKTLDGNKVFQLENYGDMGIFGSSVMSNVLPQLDELLNKYGYNLPNVGGFFSEVFNGNDAVTEITFTFDYTYKIKKIAFYTEGCGNQQQLFTSKCKELQAKSAWKDQTAMAYFTKLREMDTDLEARTPKPWIEFMTEYTYPAIYATQEEENLEQDAEGCIASALSDEGKQLGQDILDDVFSIGDAIAYKFHQQLCKDSLGEKLDEDVKLGVVVDRTMTDNPLTPEKENEKNIYAFAQEQAFQELEDAESPFVSLCARVLTGMGASSGAIGAIGGDAATKQLDLLWSEGFDDIKICGLFDILMEAITCLFSGLTLEEALGKVIEAGLRAMSINNFSDLIIGLPYDKRQEIAALAKQKLEDGDIFPEGSFAQQLSDGIAGDVELPSMEEWTERAAATEAAKNTPDASTSVSGGATDGRRTLAVDYDSGSGNMALSVDADAALGAGWDSDILEAYIKAILEVYGNDLLSLADQLDRFPGAQLIATVIALLDCPRPPLFNPGLLDWMNDIELPICKNVNDIAWPKLINPGAWWPKIMDLLALLYQAIKYAIQMLIIKILMRLIVKICELIGSAICNALGVVGDIAASLPDLLTGKDNLRNVIKDSICGDDADSDQVDDTIAQMVAELGIGGAALADREQTLQFAEGLSMSLTQAELTQALLGEPTNDTLTIIDSFIEYEHPDFRDAIPNKEAIGSFMGNIGNLLPASFLDTLRNQLDDLADDSPANPSICADPAMLEDFKALRCEILEGRASPEQCAAMYDSLKGQMTDDLGDLATALQAVSSPEALDEYLADQMPPLVSDPGCDNGLLPYEPSVTTATVTAGLGNNLEQLKLDYGTDMLGNGPGESNWGLVNMMLADTMGNPLTTHKHKNIMNPMYSDYNEGWDPSLIEFGTIAMFSPPLAIALAPWTRMFQYGAFPTKVASYLQDTMNDMAGSISVDLNNDWTSADSWTVSLDDLNMGGLFGANADLVGIPDMGYNITMDMDVGSDGDIEGVKFTAEGRKKTADLEMSFSDNARGLRSGPNGGQSVYSYGFDVKAYFGDLHKDANGEIANRKNDNVRVKIVERFNMGATINCALEASAVDADGIEDGGDGMGDADPEEASKAIGEDAVISATKFEFLAVDDTLSGISDTIGQTLQNYPSFYAAFQGETHYEPQTLLLRDMIEERGAYNISGSEVRSFRGAAMEAFMGTIMTTIADHDADIDEQAWAYGAQYDDLSKDDIMYGVNEGGSFVEYQNTEYTNRDMMLGLSRNQFDMEAAGTPELTRVYYLDPAKFGGNYMRPPLYIKPLKPIGWMGVVDVLFPELSPCKPQNTDLVDFGQIQDEVAEMYPSLSEDERLKSDPDCVLEVPYNRILDRSAKAGIYGLIIAAIRIHVSAHMVKTLPTFTKFSPEFPAMFGSAYASYIVESMEQSFLDAQSPFWEIFNTFKDSEFWYGFLEQCVQMYALRVDAGKVNPSPDVLDALFRLNDLQADYDYPYEDELKVAKATNDASFFQTLNSYRMDKNLEAVRATEEDAKLVMKEFVKEQLTYMATKLKANFAKLNLTPDVVNMDYYILENLVSGIGPDESYELTLNTAINPDGTFMATYGELPDVPYEDNEDVEEPYYTGGAELVVEEDNDGSGYLVGQEYIGYYHVHIDEDYAVVYMAGQYHSEEAHDVLKPMANIITVPIGDVPDLNTISARGDASKPLILEKYISINGVKYAPDAATAIIGSNDNEILLSDVYPGSLKIIEDEQKNSVGLEGKLGVRYGLNLYLDIGGTKYFFMHEEVDALDFKIKDFRTLAGDSKILLCLINQLSYSDKFQLLTKYCLGASHLVSLAAIYNDMGMLASIGEITVADGQTTWKGKLDYNSANKPGVHKEVTMAVDTESLNPSPVVTSVVLKSNEADTGDINTDTDGAWASAKDRSPSLFGGLFVLEYDNWDREVLRNCNGRIKKLFKTYYYSRDFDPDTIGKSSEGGPAAITLKSLRDALMPAAGKQLLPWWQRRRLKSTPFNAKDEMCEKKDV